MSRTWNPEHGRGPKPSQGCSCCSLALGLGLAGLALAGRLVWLRLR